MQDSPETRYTPTDIVMTPSAEEDSRGWYLYGIVGAGHDLTQALRDAGAAGLAEDERPLEAIASDGLVAIVRRVALAGYSVETLRARADDPAWIEAAARSHNAVISAIHAAQTILPAQFGAVYPRAEDVRDALLEERDALLERLDWLRDCDEWGVRIFGDGAALRRAAIGQESVQRLRDELASASRGRAYLLERKLADELARATERLVDHLIVQAYDQMARHVKAGLLNRRLAGDTIRRLPEGAAADAADAGQDGYRVELAYATYLTPRGAASAFIADVRAFAGSQPGLWCEYSGPWPPYSFAAALDQGDQGDQGDLDKEG